MSKLAYAMMAILCVTGSAVTADVPRTQPDQALQQLARQLEPYRDVAYATSNGYIQASPCEAHPTLGAMGHHYVRPDLLGLGPPVNGRVNGTGTYTGVNPPAILLYVPDGQGGLQLAGIEMLVFAAAWDAANNHPPMYRGRAYNYMADDPNTAQDEAHGFMPHYDLHVWLFENNPSGLYAQWNPALSCGVGTFRHVHE
ncbi:hypothetical protein [Sphingomonas xanthus]|uniref:Uncharacterized protein n=1 Tax=Sphingomonas xanthus TaxID=2594473 RepID=A0A516IRY8_9SPHN|nr:hypothetical protein [Sphingomonas xanthus]QDP19665.1 hypothetical protein FMM02_06660 [Sphingomonas xanthus]